MSICIIAVPARTRCLWDARVTVTRNGRQQELVLNVAQISSEAEQLGAGDNGMIPTDQPSPESGNQ